MRELALDSLAKATLLLLAAGALTLVWRRASAARRHLVWALALGGILALPPVELLGPAWHLPLPWRASSGSPPTHGSAPPAADRAAETAAIRTETRQDVLTTRGTTSGEAAGLVRAGVPLAIWLAALWVTGVVLVLDAFVMGHWRLMRLAAHARRVTSGEWSRLRAALGAQLGLRRSVTLLQAPDRAMPMTCGAWHPVVLLPADADAWSPSRRGDGLLHELAHVERRDCFAQLVAVVASAVYWFHPLVWVAAARLRIEREGACDLDVLDPRRQRETLSRRFARPAAVGAALVVLPLATIQPGAGAPPTISGTAATAGAPERPARDESGLRAGEALRGVPSRARLPCSGLGCLSVSAAPGGELAKHSSERPRDGVAIDGRALCNGASCRGSLSLLHGLLGHRGHRSWRLRRGGAAWRRPQPARGDPPSSTEPSVQPALGARWRDGAHYGDPQPPEFRSCPVPL